PPVARGHRSASVKHMSKRSSKYSFVTPVTGRMVDICARGVTSVVTPRFDSRVLRTPALNEHISTSANGSPLADPRDPVLIVPLGGGECLCLTAEDVTKKNFLQLNREARGLMKNLSVTVRQCCPSVISQ
ncbi:BORE1 protein, partial [Daphoenositta chrysoptera]|nr:BORE1 protein [Daphoenositta chrysoptera]